MKKKLLLLVLPVVGLGVYLLSRRTSSASNSPARNILSTPFLDITLSWSYANKPQPKVDGQSLVWAFPFAFKINNPNKTKPVYIDRIEGKVTAEGNTLTNYTVYLAPNQQGVYLSPDTTTKQIQLNVMADLYRVNGLLASNATIVAKANESLRSLVDPRTPNSFTLRLLASQNRSNNWVVFGPASTLAAMYPQDGLQFAELLFRNINFGKPVTIDATVYYGETNDKNALQQVSISGSTTI